MRLQRYADCGQDPSGPDQHPWPSPPPPPPRAVRQAASKVDEWHLHCSACTAHLLQQLWKTALVSSATLPCRPACPHSSAAGRCAPSGGHGIGMWHVAYPLQPPRQLRWSGSHGAPAARITAAALTHSLPLPCMRGAPATQAHVLGHLSSTQHKSGLRHHTRTVPTTATKPAAAPLGMQVLHPHSCKAPHNTAQYAAPPARHHA